MEEEKQQNQQQNQHIPQKKADRVERIEAHLNKLHDFVRSLDLRIESLEFESEKKRAIEKAVAAKIGKVKQECQYDQNQGQELPQRRRELQPGQPLRRREEQP